MINHTTFNYDVQTTFNHSEAREYRSKVSNTEIHAWHDDVGDDGSVVKPCRISEGVSHWTAFLSLFGSQITSAEREVGVERSGGRLNVMCLFLRRRYSHGHHTLVQSIICVRTCACVRVYWYQQHRELFNESTDRRA